MWGGRRVKKITVSKDFDVDKAIQVLIGLGLITEEEEWDCVHIPVVWNRWRINTSYGRIYVANVGYWNGGRKNDRNLLCALWVHHPHVKHLCLLLGGWRMISQGNLKGVDLWLDIWWQTLVSSVMSMVLGANDVNKDCCSSSRLCASEAFLVLLLWLCVLVTSTVLVVFLDEPS